MGDNCDWDASSRLTVATLGPLIWPRIACSAIWRCRKICSLRARSRLYMGPNLLRPPRIRSARTAANGEEEEEKEGLINYFVQCKRITLKSDCTRKTHRCESRNCCGQKVIKDRFNTVVCPLSPVWSFRVCFGFRGNKSETTDIFCLSPRMRKIHKSLPLISRAMCVCGRRNCSNSLTQFVSTIKSVSYPPTHQGVPLVASLPRPFKIPARSRIYSNSGNGWAFRVHTIELH